MAPTRILVESHIRLERVSGLVIAKDMEELFNFLIDTFHFSIGQRVKGSG